jgi:hypothetical protein
MLQTMNRDSTAAMLIYGAVLGLVAWSAAALTGTGPVGVYAFGFLGMTALLVFLMWPERTRFFIDRSVAQKRDDQR